VILPLSSHDAAVIELWHLPVLFAVAVMAGFVDAVAGGGGLITLPVLLNLGIHPLLALGTNKLQGTFGSASATWHYAAAGTVLLRDCLRGFIITLLAAVVGALSVQFLERALLQKFIPVLLVLVAGFLLARPSLGEQDHPARFPRVWFDVGAGLLLGFYDGFFGPGTGTFWALAFVFGLGFNLTRATGYTKVMNLASNLGALLVFACAGQVLWLAGCVMGLGQLLGARIGARMVVARGFRFIRPVFIIVVVAITARLIYVGWLQAGR